MPCLTRREWKCGLVGRGMVVVSMHLHDEKSGVEEGGRSRGTILKG
jgi:hypothetical protein